MPAGRPTKLTEELILRICSVISDGNYHTIAAKVCGIPLRTFRHWLAQGKKYPNGIYGELLHLVKETEANAEAASVKLIKGSADYKHLEWWLERKFPQRWGRYRGELVELKKRIEALEAAQSEDTDDDAEA